MCKTGIPQFLQSRTKNRAKPHHRKPLRPLQHDSSEFFYRHATVATYRIPGELQGLYRERRGRERERERATVELKLARDRPERSVAIRKKKKKHSGTQGRVTCGFQYISFCVTRMLRDHLVERLLCDYWGYCLIIISSCTISNSHNH